MVTMSSGLKSSYLFQGMKHLKLLIMSAIEMLTSGKWLRWQSSDVLWKSREEGGRRMQASFSKERTDYESIRHADRAGMEMRVRHGELIAGCSTAICKEMRKCVCRARRLPAKGYA